LPGKEKEGVSLRRTIAPRPDAVACELQASAAGAAVLGLEVSLWQVLGI